MSDNFRAEGSFTADPLTGFPSGDFACAAPLDETLVLDSKSPQEFNLTTDAPVAVAFGGIVNANVVIIKAVGGKVRARLTSADGSLQSVPIDSMFFLMSSTVPITAIDLTRTTGVLTTVKIFLGEKA